MKYLTKNLSVMHCNGLVYYISIFKSLESCNHHYQNFSTVSLTETKNNIAMHGLILNVKSKMCININNLVISHLTECIRQKPLT